MNQGFLSSWFQNADILGNAPFAYLCAILAFAIALTILKIVKNIGLARLKAMAGKAGPGLDGLAVTLLEKFQWYEYQLAAFFLASRYLERSFNFDKVLNIAILFVFTYRAITLIQQLISYWLTRVAANRELSGEARDSVVNGAQVILRALVWLAAALFVLENLGVNISTVLAGLGIGGVAVALAAQTILGDLFNFFVILLDKPFRTGDFVICEDIQGTIEHVGVKSTRIRSLAGELIIVSNSKLLAAGLHNYNQMDQRRALFTVNVSYQTAHEKLRRIPGIIKSAVSATANTRFDRSNITAYADFAVQFETVYYVTGREYALYAATHEEVLLKIGEAFKAEGIEFAYLAQPLFVRK